MKKYNIIKKNIFKYWHTLTMILKTYFELYCKVLLDIYEVSLEKHDYVLLNDK